MIEKIAAPSNTEQQTRTWTGRMSRWGKTLANQRWAPAAVLFLVCLAGYGLLAPTLGFYWDDWPALFLVRQKEALRFLEFYTFDRPFSAWTFLVTVPLLGSQPLAWHLFTLVIRWLSALGLWWTLRGVWPERRLEALATAALFAVYPSFNQQSVSVAYSQHFLTYALFTLSLGAMVWAVRRPRWFLPLMAFSVLSDALQLFSMEYFGGLELLRPILLWLALGPRGLTRPSRLLQTMRLWLPFAAILLTFGVWRFGMYAPALGQLDENSASLLARFRTEPLGALLSFLRMGFQDMAHVLVASWANTVKPESIEINEAFFLFSVAVGLAAAILTAAWGMWVRPAGEQAEGATRNFTGQWLLIGLAAMLLGGLPVWMTDRQAIVGLWSDRFTLAPMLGASLLVVCAGAWLAENRRRRVVVLGILVGLAVAMQLRTGNQYRLNWNIQKDFYWQLAWRAPGLKPGTTVLVSQMPFNLVADYSIAAAVNSIYAPQASPLEIPYWFLSAPRYRYGEIGDFQNGQPIQYSLRTFNYSASTSDSLVVWDTSGPSCLRVLTPGDVQTPSFDDNARDLTAIGHLDPILAEPENPVHPPEEIFGPEPAHTWCYYYQKADLARQRGDWGQVVELARQARQQGYRPLVGYELFPFMEAYAYTGRWDEALESTRQANALTENLEPMLCSFWERIVQETGASQAAAAIRAELQCDLPNSN